MISDVLSEAIVDINYYLTNPVFQPVYARRYKELQKLISDMERIRKGLDSTMPFDNE